MISLRTFALFALGAGALIVTPGPAVLFIVARSVHQGRRAGLVSALGVAAGGLVHVSGAVLGFSALLASSALAFSTVKVLGAGYLLYLGVRAILGRVDVAAVEEAAPAPLQRLFTQGFVVNLLNPKTALFFLAFLPQFVDPARGHIPLQMLVLGGTFVVLAISSDSTYALLAGMLANRLGRTPRARRSAGILSGSIYIALGVGTILAGSRGD